MIPWNERVTSFQINPESATLGDIIRMAEELIDLRDSFAALKGALKSVIADIEEWENNR